MPDVTPPVPASAVTSLLKIANWEGTPQEIHEAFTVACDADDYWKCIKGLKELEIDPQSYINNLDKLIDSLPTNMPDQKRCKRALRRTCGVQGILPTRYTVHYKFPEIDRRGKPDGKGGQAEVWKLTAEEGGKFAVKIFDVKPWSDGKAKKRYYKEVSICKRVSHENILSFEGISSSIKFSIVSRWMENGTLPTYLKKNPEVNHLHLLVGVSRGLRYLHDCDIVHKDLKGANILVDPNGNPLLTDFGISSITRNVESVNASTSNYSRTIPFCAPEIHEANDHLMSGRKPKKRPFEDRCKSDVYSLSMVIVEVTTGKQPFSEVDRDTISSGVRKGVRPTKPRQFEAPGITPGVWGVAEKCWNQNPAKRPTSSQAHDMLAQISNNCEDGVARARAPALERIISGIGQKIRGNSKSPGSA